MVIKHLAMFLCFIAVNVTAGEQTSYSAKDLESILKDGEREKKSAADRLKASRGDSRSLRILQEKDLNYKLPNGEYVLGMLLPDGKKTPAVRTRFGNKPACVTKDYQLVAGIWDNSREQVMCNIASSELAYVENDGVTYYSTSEDAERGQPTYANKYGGTSDGTTGAEQNEETATAPTGSNHPTESELAAATTAAANKYGNNPRQSSQQRSTSASGEYVYVPPPRNSSTINTVAGAIVDTSNEFGIPLGTWFQAKLERTASSAESGQIEFKLLNSIEGARKTIPAGTIIFANKSFNPTSKRLEALTTVAVTPEGVEINGIAALVYSRDKTAGITGTIVRDRDGEMISAGSSVLLAAAGEVIPDSTGLATNAASTFANEMINNERRNSPDTPKAYIQVSPQVVWLRFSRKL